MLIRDVFFCLNYMLALLAVFVTTMTFDLLGDLNGGSAVMLILPLIVAAMIEGQQFARTHSEKPTTQQCWQASLRMTAFVILILLSAFIPVLLVDQVSSTELAKIDATGRAAVYLLLCFSACCTLRVGYAIGLATEAKAQQFPDN